MTLLAEVTDVLVAGPGRTAGEVRDELRARGRASVTTADVARILTTYERRFSDDGGEPPRWWPADDTLPAPGAGPAGRGGGARRAGSTWRGPLLYSWQREALDAWRGRGGRGVIEAVTGTGKTMVGIAAASEGIAAGGQVCVVVPTRELLSQWRGALTHHLPAHISVGSLGDGHRDRLDRHDVLVAVVNSARVADLVPRRPRSLLVADECHRYGSDGNRLALAAGFERRLGLSATYARSDDGHLAWLDPYFGGACFRVGYRRAIADGVTARFRVALLGVRFDPGERADYDALCEAMSAARAQLVTRLGVEPEPIGAFLAAVALLARSGDDEGAAGVARRYLRAMQDRRALLAETPAKTTVLAGLVPALRAADRAIVFTQSIAAAERASAMLDEAGLRSAAVHSRQPSDLRRAVLARFAAGGVQVVAAPQVLDEGIDVPAADLAVILAASRSRRQMVQRMGRVLRRKADGRLARFVVVSVEGTVEDPARGAHEGFLDEVVPVAESVRRFPPGSVADACSFAMPHQL